MVTCFLIFGAKDGIAQERAATRFDFGSGPEAAGWTRVLTEAYSSERGWGFEPGAQIEAVDRGGADALRQDLATSRRPYSFSVKLPEGNYRVTAILGDAAGETHVCIKAELRRLAVERVDAATATFAERTFVVNLRTPAIRGGGEVRLKDRERASERLAWDDKLTLEFNGDRPNLCALSIEPVDVPTLYLLGDSTVCDQPNEPYASWGQMLPRFFGPTVAVANHAESGESLRSSLGAKRLDKVLGEIESGDWLLVQFGHNDMKAVDESSYQSDLRRFVREARERGARAIVVTPMERRGFDADGKVRNSLRGFPEAARAAAREEGATLIDLNAMSKTLYEALGPEGSLPLFKPGDGTHHSNYGAYELAKCVVEGIKRDRPDLAKHLLPDLPTFDPARPDKPAGVRIPASPGPPGSKPDGN